MQLPSLNIHAMQSFIKLTHDVSVSSAKAPKIRQLL